MVKYALPQRHAFQFRVPAMQSVTDLLVRFAKRHGNGRPAFDRFF